MKFWPSGVPRGERGSLFRIAVLSGMAVLLVVVGVLQYRWATELSAATEVRIGSDLQSVMTRWHRDLYEELSGICVALQVGPDAGAHDAWNDYLQRYAAWNRAAGDRQLAEEVFANPDLVKNVYIWQTSGRGNPELLRLSRDGKNLAAVAVPQELQRLLVRLQSKSSSLRVGMRAWSFRPLSGDELAAADTRVGSSGSRNNALAGWQFDQDIPAVVHPIVHHADPLNSQTPVNRATVDWLIVVLQFNVIQSRILPDLAMRHFGDQERLEYDVAVVATGDQSRIIYSSNPSLRFADTENFDSVMNIFGQAAPDESSDFWKSVKQKRTLQGQEWRNFSAPGWFPVVQYSSVEQPWLLVVKHRTGPLAAMARSVWHRDLIIAGVVVLLLAANMALVVLSSNRVHKFAKVQMEFVASISHELRTPLAAIYSAAENIRDGFVEGRASLNFYGSLLTSQARQLTDLVDRILLFASTRSGKTRYVIRPLPISEILQAVRKNTAELIEGAGYKLQETVQPGLPCVLGDLSGVCTCLQNLITNAVKYGGADHWIGLSASCDASQAGKEVRISVEDHGQGIRNSELPHIFDPFYRSPEVVAAQIHGTGLGLALAKHIAEALGGTITVVSRVGAGSIFTLQLRAVDEQTSNSVPTLSGTDKVDGYA